MEMENQGDEWNKKFLETLLYSNSDRLVIKANDKGKNPFIWSQFRIAYIDGVEQKYACCNFCKTFIKYSGRTGTGGLMRHLCFRRLHAVKYMKKRKKPEEEKDGGSKLAQNTCVRLKLEDMIHRNSPRIGYVPNAKGKSKIWSQFRIISVDNALSKFACCMMCRSIVTYTGRTGTGSMVRHKCSKNKYVKRLDADEEVDQVIDPVYTVIKSEESFDWDEKDSSDPESDVNRTSPPIPEGVPKAKVEEQSGIPAELKRIIREKHTALMNRSLRLFENEEFLELAQFLVHLGAQYGPVDVKDIFRRKTNLPAFNEG
ncbi:UNVERIFIED_CONTAM: hypothetical protein PYX00_001644 [Menopon gallinae]|uniref:BED-type domain-containing protein n=1 Tax=Menopon gallinae TaxID=328185 RepID=A0AAW2IDS9_9NEOP